MQAYLIRVGDINEREQTFSADLYLWITWPLGGATPDLDFVNAVDYEIVYDVESELQLPDRTVMPRRDTRVRGTFASDMNLQQFPFDRQTIQIILEDRLQLEEDLVFLPPAAGSVTQAGLVLADWNLDSVDADVVSYRYPFTEPGETAPSTYSRYRLNLHLSRQLPFYLTRFFTPLLLIIGIAFLALYVSPDRVDARIGMTLTSMLTIIAFSFSINEWLPRVSYVVLLDRVLMISYIFVFMILAVCIVSTVYLRHGLEPKAVALDRASRPTLLVVLGLALGAAALLS